MRQETLGSILLIGATVVVGLSIVLDGSVAKLLNGIGGFTWFVAAALLLVAALRTNRSPLPWIGVVLLTALVAFVIRPSDIVPAIIGFGIAGTAIVSLASPHDLLWAKLLVGMYLPFHIGAAITKAVIRSNSGMEATVRADPPPTAALVPFVMVLAAMGGGLLAQHLAKFRRGHRQRLLVPDS